MLQGEAMVGALVASRTSRYLELRLVEGRWGVWRGLVVQRVGGLVCCF
jgi:hypothetical protein